MTHSEVYYRVPTLLVTKISRTFPRTFQDPKSIFPGPFCTPVMFKCRDKQQLLTIYKHHTIAVSILQYTLITVTEKKNGTIGRDSRTRKLRHLHLHHCVRLPHHGLENSSPFQDLALKFPGLSRTNQFSRTFQGLKILPKKSRTFQEAWKSCIMCVRYAFSATT